jgi:hypothetical protein
VRLYVAVDPRCRGGEPDAAVLARRKAGSSPKGGRLEVRAPAEAYELAERRLARQLLDGERELVTCQDAIVERATDGVRERVDLRMAGHSAIRVRAEGGEP